MNAFTVRKVALGLAKFIKANSNEATIVVFTILDYFQKLSKELSTILADNGVKVITAESYKSTPELSCYKILRADGGVMITASHNPKNYNGIKVYNEYGGQLLPKDSEILSSYIDEIENPLDIEIGSFDKLVAKDQINFASKDVRNNYINEVIRATETLKKNAKQY